MIYKREKLGQLTDYFLNLSKRLGKGVYFYRIFCWNAEISEFVEQYLDTARRYGVVIQGKIPNPDEKQLSYYTEMMGQAFSQDVSFLMKAIEKWLPRLNGKQRESVVSSMINTLDEMKKEGKSQDMIRNAYIKFMCWLYYKFERILHLLGQDAVPKILYEGRLSRYELDLLCILADAGCDIICLEYEGDTSYQKLDPENKRTNPYLPKEQLTFPEGFCIEYLIRKRQRNERISMVYDRQKVLQPCTNVWMPENWELFTESLKEPRERGEDKEIFYNLFVRIRGVWDKVSYVQDLFHWKTQLETKKRNFFVIEDLFAPQNEEIRMVSAKNYTDMEQMILDLTPRLKTTGQESLDHQVRMAFAKQMMAEDPEWEGSIHKKRNAAVYLICWFNRYFNQIFTGYQKGKIGIVVYFGACKNQYEACFFRMLAWMPLDVVILSPDANVQCCLTDKRLLEKSYTDTLRIDHFPETAGACKARTVAYHAEQELNEMLYQDTGMYRDRQYQKADAVLLKTMYEEVGQLWDQELKYRPGFEIIQDKVMMPVLAAKICGVKEKEVDVYWKQIRKLCTAETLVVTQPGWFQKGDSFMGETPKMIVNGKVDKKKAKESRSYAYAILREEVQDYILDKTEQVIKQKLICGTFERGMEYRILAVALDLKKEVVRLIQQFDFTKKNPKLLVISVNEKTFPVEDCIGFALLSVMGFDVGLFVPTGYQVFEQNFNKVFWEEHQAGDYLYDLHIPALKQEEGGLSQIGGFFNRIFKRG